jgi:hypothetical protein
MMKTQRKRKGSRMDARLTRSVFAPFGNALRKMGAGALLWTGALASAASVQYTVTDLPDSVLGQDLWRVDYSVQGPFATFDALDLLFTPGQFSSLSLLSNDQSTKLDTLLSQPDPGLGTDGQLLLTALSPLDSSFAAKVSLRFTWGGLGKPGPQHFDVLDGDFNVVSSGQTTVATTVPEVDVIWMALLGGSIAWAGVRRRRAS